MVVDRASGLQLCSTAACQLSVPSPFRSTDYVLDQQPPCVRMELALCASWSELATMFSHDQ